MSKKKSAKSAKNEASSGLSTLNLKNAAHSLKHQIEDGDFGNWIEFRKNPVMVFQLANLYNASQVIAGKQTIFPIDKLKTGNGPSQSQFQKFMKTIEDNLRHPLSSQEAARNFVMVMGSVLEHIAISAGYAKSPETSKKIQMYFNEATQVMGELASELIEDKSIGFDKSTRAFGDQLVSSPESGKKLAKKLKKNYGVE
jgi:hypothetical protein